MPHSSGRVNQILYIFLSVICSKNYTEKSIDKILQLDQPEEKQTRHWIALTWDVLKSGFKRGKAVMIMNFFQIYLLIFFYSIFFYHNVFLVKKKYMKLPI